MSPHRRICVLFLCACVLLVVLTPAAHASQPAFPGFTVIVGFPPSDLEVSLRFQDGEDFTTVHLSKEQIAWEARYRFNYAMAAQVWATIEDAKLVVSGGGKTFECSLPELVLGMHESDMLFLDIAGQTVTSRKPVGRTVSLVSMRVLLPLILEGALFFVFGYRKKRSWIAFATINLITQSALNIGLLRLSSLAGPFLVLYMIPLAVPVLIVELIAFAVSVNEHHRLRTVAYVVAANVLSLVLGGFLISYLPV